MNKATEWWQRLTAHAYFPILILLIANLVIGALLVTDYGESRDEIFRYRYARNSLAAYSGGSADLKDEKGAFYVMVAKAGSDAIRSIYNGWRAMEAWHFMHFLSFLMGLFFFYQICLQLVNGWAAFSATLLFNTQPLLWGHAFINPKDIPFMAFFLASVATGMIMVSALTRKFQSSSPDGGAPSATSPALRWREEWVQNSRTKRTLLVALSALSVALLIALVFASDPLQVQTDALITQAYHAQPTSLPGALFARLAPNAAQIPLESYLSKAESLYPRLAMLYTLLVLLLNLVILRALFPRHAAWLWQNRIKPFLKQVLSSLASPQLWVAAVFLGLCSAIRVLGPAAGLLVAGYFLLVSWRKAIPPLIAYFAIALLVTYLAWPGLWGNPLGNFTSSLGKAADFPWEGKVLFAGAEYLIDELPRRFLPTLMALQFTETALLAFLAGLALAIYGALQRTIQWQKVTLLAAWLFIPLSAVVLLQPKMYDNFRQFLYIVPPIFIFAAIAIQALFNWIKKPVLNLLLVAVLVAPGIYWNFKLHPYEYVYYNNLVGGVKGAFRSYEMDYWATSYREATQYLNATAPHGARVIVLGPDHIVSAYAREDLVIENYRRAETEKLSPRDFAIILAGHQKDLTLFPGSTNLFQIGRDGAIFTVVQQLQPDNPPGQP